LVDIKGRKVLVTGGAGFIGSHTVDALVQKGADVVIVDNLSSGRQENVNPCARFYNVNLAEDTLDSIMDNERPEVVYYFGFYGFIPKTVENPLLDMDALAGSLRILQKAKELRVKKNVLASSGFVYGGAPNLPTTEECPIDPVSPYVVSKHAIENYLRFFKKAFDIPYVILRYGTIYGPRQVTGALADYIRKLSSGRQGEMWGDGNKTRDYVYIEDAVRANLLALSIPSDHPNPVFNIGTGTETTLNVLYKKIADILGVEARPIYYPDRSGEHMRYCLDNTKAIKELGWKPKCSLDEGLRNTVQSHLD